MKSLKKEDITSLAIGGAILGGGGGGDWREGIKIGEQAFTDGQFPTIINVNELEDDDIVLTISAVGAPSAKEQYVSKDDYRIIVQLIEENMEGRIKGFITNEMGGASSFNAFIPSALKGIPMLDGACNGRAHPLGTMGAMGLAEQSQFITKQSASGGNPKNHKQIKLWVEGSVTTTSSAVRNAAVNAGGLVVVARNAICNSYVAEHGATGCLSQSYELGIQFLTGKTAIEKIENVVRFLHGKILCSGKIKTLNLTMSNGLDEGFFTIQNGQDEYKIYIWNEYMAANQNNVRLYTFPDLLMTFDKETGYPISSAELNKNQEIVVIAVPFKYIKLGAGMREISGFEAIEKCLKIPIIAYLDKLLNI